MGTERAELQHCLWGDLQKKKKKKKNEEEEKEEKKRLGRPELLIATLKPNKALSSVKL